MFLFTRLIRHILYLIQNILVDFWFYRNKKKHLNKNSVYEQIYIDNFKIVQLKIFS